MKKKLLVLVAVVALLALATMPAFAGEQTTVGCTVTPRKISVVIPSGYPTQVGYGVLNLNTEATPATYNPVTYSYLRVENDATVREDFFIRGDDAYFGGSTWTLGSSNGSDIYVHSYGVGVTPPTYTALNKAGTQVLASDVAVNGTADFNLKIKTPVSTSGYGEYSTSVIVIAIEG